MSKLYIKKENTSITLIDEKDIDEKISNEINGKEVASNKVTTISANSTDTQYPSAKCVYDLIGDINDYITS